MYRINISSNSNQVNDFPMGKTRRATLIKAEIVPCKKPRAESSDRIWVAVNLVFEKKGKFKIFKIWDPQNEKASIKILKFFLFQQLGVSNNTLSIIDTAEAEEIETKLAKAKSEQSRIKYAVMFAAAYASAYNTALCSVIGNNYTVNKTVTSSVDPISGRTYEIFDYTIK